MRVRNVAAVLLAAAITQLGVQAEAADTVPVPVGPPLAAVLRNQAGATVGSVTFQSVGGRTRVRAQVTGLAPLAEFHGIHVHTNGACEGDFVTSAGGHWNPTAADHGGHAGDMPILYADEVGTATSSFTTDAFTTEQLINDPGGVAVIVHGGRDNYDNIPTRYSVAGVAGPDATTKATGDAGARFACGVVERGSATAPTGYWMVGADGGIFNHGTAGFNGSEGGKPLAKPIVAMAATPGGAGYYSAASDGGVFAHGNATFEGSAGGIRLASPVVGMAVPPHQAGAVLRDQAGKAIGHVGFTQDGTHVRASAYVTGLAPFAEFHGFHVHTNGACTGDFTGAGGHWNPTASTHGDHAGDMPVLYADAGGTARATYTLDAFTVANLLDDEGGVAVIVHGGRDNYGNIPARYLAGGVAGPDATSNSTGDAGARMVCGVVGATGGSPRAGYWLVAADGGVFAYGDAPFLGSLGGTQLSSPIVGMAVTPTGAGYWLVAASGQVTRFGDAPVLDAVPVGAAAGAPCCGAPVVGMAPTPTGLGYALFGSDGVVATFGDAIFHGSASGVRLTQPIVGGALTESGYGYELFGRDGGVFTYGDARFEGSEGATRLDRPVVGGASRR